MLFVVLLSRNLPGALSEVARKKPLLQQPSGSSVPVLKRVSVHKHKVKQGCVVKDTGKVLRLSLE
jgi:hypothetical protein